jgi:hypothetical protein
MGEAINNSILQYMNPFVFAGIAAVLTAITAAIGWFCSKHLVKWVLAVVTVGVVVLVLLYYGGLREDEFDSGLPSIFMPPMFAVWLIVLTLAAIYFSVHFVSVLLRVFSGRVSTSSSEGAAFPDLESAWDEIQIRLSHAQYDAGHQKVFLLLTTEESIAASFIQSAGLQFFAVAPVDQNAPIHAYATADALFISCAGASSWGRAGDEGPARLVNLCGKIRELNREQPVLRGMAVLYPMEKAASTELLQSVGALRNDLQTIRAELNVRCPTVAVFCRHEPYTGFDDFAMRIPSNVRSRRAGFSVPVAQPFDRPAGQKGLGWLVQWFSMWSLKLMCDNYHETEGNKRLVLMNARLWHDLPAIRHLLEVSFSAHARAEAVLVRGVYFASCGADRDTHAFVAGLINGQGSKIIADGAYTSWSRGADAVDRRYRLASLGLGLAAGAIALPIWFWEVIGRLSSDAGPDQKSHWLPGVAVACLGVLALIWIAGLIYHWSGSKKLAAEAPKT